MEQNEKSYFKVLNDVNVNENKKTIRVGGRELSYLSWTWAWTEVKKRYPDATYTIYENKDGWNYHTDGLTCWVKTGVTINGIEHIEYLPVMDNKNNSILKSKVTSFDVNTAIQRSITKACARHGIGLYVYAGEDLPECERDVINVEETERPKKQPKNAPNDRLERAIAEVGKCVSRAELSAIWNNYKDLQSDQRFWDAAENKGKEFAA